MDSNKIKADQFDVTKLKINSTVKALANGSKHVYVNYNGRAPLVMQTEPMSCPFGINPGMSGDKGDTTKYELQVPVTKNDVALRAMLESMDEAGIQAAFDNSMAFFGKKRAADVIKDTFSPSIKPSKEPYDPKFKMNIPFRDGNFGDLVVYDRDNNELNAFETLTNPANTKGATVKAIIQCTGMWISGSSVGYSWKILKLKILESLSSSKNVAFDDDDSVPQLSNEVKNLKVSPAASASASGKKAPTTTYVSDSDDDEEKVPVVAVAAPAVPAEEAEAEEEEDEEEEEKAPPAAKVVATSKKTVAAPVPAPAPAPAPASDDDEEEAPVMTRTFNKAPVRKSTKK